MLPVAALIWLDTDMLQWMVPAILFGTYLINGMLFMAGLVLLERSEGTLQALAVSPLRTHQYVIAKIASLCLLSLAESVLITVLLGVSINNLFTLMLGVVVATTMLAAFGLMLAIRYRSINELLMPAVGWGMLSQLPLLPYFHIGDYWFAWLHPLHPALVLLESGVDIVPLWEQLLAVGLGLVGVLLSTYLAVKAMRGFMVGGASK
ncbi:MAG: ABC transporter [Lysobacteraceae bacterium]|nr:MAG: ABC transporter [Xanthomonadaceae bacterium]